MYTRTCLHIYLICVHAYMYPYQKILGCGFSTPCPLFCLICTIISSKTGYLDPDPSRWPGSTPALFQEDFSADIGVYICTQKHKCIYVGLHGYTFARAHTHRYKRTREPTLACTCVCWNMHIRIYTYVCSCQYMV